jgi:hypothetical protein
MDIDDATGLLQSDGVQPLWTWPEFGSLGANQTEDNQPKVLLTPEPWDYDDMHHDPFNMLRFYLPYLGPFRNIETLFFADDDIMVQRDISLLEVPMGEGMVIAGTCNGWIWNDQCMRNDLFYSGMSWYDFPVTYLGKDKAHHFKSCSDDADEAERLWCQSDEYEIAVNEISQSVLGFTVNYTAQPRWNFGMARFNLTEWRLQKMTEKFDAFMHANCG